MEYVGIGLKEGIVDLIKIMGICFDHPYDSEKIYERLKGKKYWLYFAKDKNKIVGFKLWYEEKGEIYSWLGGVTPEYRRKGIASKLLEIQINLSKKLGYKKINLKSHKGHPEMILFCKKKEFKQTKIEKDHWHPGLDAIFFEMGI